MTFGAITTQLSGVQDVISGNITYEAVSQSLVVPQPQFAFGKKEVFSKIPKPFIVWEPTRTETIEQRNTLGQLPRPLYLEKVHITAWVQGINFDTTHYIAEHVKRAVRLSPAWFEKNIFSTMVMNPVSAQNNLWTERVDLVLYNPISDLMPLTGTIGSVNFVTSSAFAVSGGMQMPSGSF